MRKIQRDIVGSFIFSNDNHVLLGKNGKGGVYEDLWVIPGGGIEEGETKLQAVARETLEEVGIDISTAKVSQIDVMLTGESEKTLRGTNEIVLVQMTFYNFKVEFNLPASKIKIRLEDDLSEAVWTPFTELDSKSFSPSVEKVLKHLGCLR